MAKKVGKVAKKVGKKVKQVVKKIGSKLAGYMKGVLGKFLKKILAGILKALKVYVPCRIRAPTTRPRPLPGALPAATAASAFYVKRRCEDDGNATWAPKAEDVSIRNAFFNTGPGRAPYFTILSALPRGVGSEGGRRDLKAASAKEVSSRNAVLNQNHKRSFPQRTLPL